MPRCLRGAPDPERSPSSGGGPLVGKRSILPHCGTLGDHPGYLGEITGELQRPQWRQRRGESRPLSAKPPKVKTKREDQLRLAERLREIGVTCKACLQGPWYHKPHDGGEGCYKHMISVGSVSSPMSIADLRKKGGASTAQAADPATTGDYTTAKNSQRPLSEYVRFETKEGMAFLFHPSRLDKRTGKGLQVGQQAPMPRQPEHGGSTLTRGE